MRHIGTLPDRRQAAKFQDYALTMGIKTRVDEEQDAWAVWIFDEDQVDRGRDEFEKFREQPDAEIYQEASAAAGHLRAAQERKQRQAQKKTVNVSERWRRPLTSRAPVTVTLIAISLFVVVTTRLGSEHNAVFDALSIASFERDGGYIRWSGLEDVRSGEAWRLVTPIFLHFGLLHILFNMLMLFQLGLAVELRRGSWRYLLMVLAIAIPSNLGQYLVSGPAFGGMSGVVYGLFGYIWMKSRSDPGSGFHMPSNTVVWLMAWFFMGVFQLIPHIANMAHGAGLVVGMILGYAPALLRKLR